MCPGIQRGGARPHILRPAPEIRRTRQDVANISNIDYILQALYVTQTLHAG